MHEPADFDVVISGLRLELSEPFESAHSFEAKLSFGNYVPSVTARVVPTASGFVVRGVVASC